jgi:hypothetical protein
LPHLKGKFSWSEKMIVGQFELPRHAQPLHAWSASMPLPARLVGQKTPHSSSGIVRRDAHIH